MLMLYVMLTAHCSDVFCSISISKQKPQLVLCHMKPLVRVIKLNCEGAFKLNQ